jgi:hypothetical protein
VISKYVSQKFPWATNGFWVLSETERADSEDTEEAYTWGTGCWPGRSLCLWVTIWMWHPTLQS